MVTGVQTCALPISESCRVKYLLDSNIIIALTMNRNEGVVRRAAECDEGDMVTSAIAYAEVAFGSHRGDPPAVEQLSAFVEEVPVLAVIRIDELLVAQLMRPRRAVLCEILRDGECRRRIQHSARLEIHPAPLAEVVRPADEVDVGEVSIPTRQRAVIKVGVDR